MTYIGTTFKGGKISRIFPILILITSLIILCAGTVSAAEWTVGPGGSYNYNSIQGAINNESTLSGDVIIVSPNGTDPYTENVIVTKSLNIVANGTVTVSGSVNPSSPVITINSAGSLTKISGFNLTGSTGSAGVFINGANNVSLANLTTNNCQEGIRTQNSNNLTVENVTVVNAGGNGVLLSGGAGVSVVDVTVVNAGGNGVLLSGDVTNVALSGLNISGARDCGVLKDHYSGLSGFSIVDSVISDSGNYGVKLDSGYRGWYPVSGVVVLDNVTVGRSGVDGALLVIDGVGNVTVVNSTFTGNSRGLNLGSRGVINVTGCVFRDNRDWGVSLRSFDAVQAVFTGNTVTNNSNGLWLQSIIGSNFQNNVIINSTGPDLYATADTNNTFTNLTLGLLHPTTLTFDYINGISMRAVTSPPADPVGWTNIGKYVDIQPVGSTIITRLWIHYNTEDVVNKNETHLRMYRYTGGAWAELPEPNGVNTDHRYVYAEGISSFSTFAPLTEKFSTYLEVADVTGYRNAVYELRAILKDSSGSGVAGKEVKFFVNGTEIGRSTTDSMGTAVINHTLNETAGTYDLSAVFEGDEFYKASENNTATLVVNKRPTALTVNSVVGINGQDVELAARLTSDGVPVAGETIKFTVEGETYYLTTGDDGWARRTYTINMTPGRYNIGAEFTETDLFLGSTGTAILAVNRKAENLVVTPLLGIAPLNITAAASITNIGDLPYNYTAVFYVNGDPVEIRKIEVPAGQTVSVDFTRTLQDPGAYNVTIDDLTPQSVTVLKPANITANDLNVTLTNGTAPLNITVTAKLTNNGDVDGDYTAELKVNGSVVDAKTVTVPAHSNTTVQFTRILQAGSYNVTIDDLTPQSVTVLKPANITASNLYVTPTTGLAPLKITVNAALKNTGDVPGIYIARLKLNGVVRATQNLTVGAGETRNVTFSWTLQSGTYTVTVDELPPLSVTVRSPGLAIGSISVAANTLKIYYERYRRLPSTITIGGQRYTMGQLLYILCRATINLNRGDLSPIAPRNVGAPTAPRGTYGHGSISRREYVRVAGYVIDFINRYKRAPNYAVTGIGRMSFQRLTYMYSSIIGFYQKNRRLPAYFRI